MREEGNRGLESDALNEFGGRAKGRETEFTSVSVAKQGRSMLRPYGWPNIYYGRRSRTCSATAKA